MSTGQNQDLTIFKDNSLLSDAILSSESSLLSTITYVQGTSPQWLINSLIENALQGTAALVNNDLNQKIRNRSEVEFVSFLHPLDYYVKNCKKNGLDLTHSPGFTFIDYFSQLFTENIKDTTSSKKEISKMFDDITKKLKISNNKKKVVFIELPEVLLQATDFTSDGLLAEILKVNRLCRQLFIISAKDHIKSFNLDSSIPQDPVFKTTDFLVKLFHRSHYNISLSPLSTGRASDITGSLTISKGSLPVDSVVDRLVINEKEYIYHITKDSNIRLFFR
ncbi:uncharacterized protein RJT20DRAFT_134018 [Scheffersomyces xylosifermentans]|uniref:uncharacterized protein n=1 Tax=Scheffersomyces xylosifermentans TaxID=1304137 RepID=UPI00315D0EC4